MFVVNHWMCSAIWSKCLEARFESKRSVTFLFSFRYAFIGWFTFSCYVSSLFVGVRWNAPLCNHGLIKDKNSAHGHSWRVDISKYPQFDNILTLKVNAILSVIGKLRGIVCLIIIIRFLPSALKGSGVLSYPERAGEWAAGQTSPVNTLTSIIFHGSFSNLARTFITLRSRTSSIMEVLPH